MVRRTGILKDGQCMLGDLLAKNPSKMFGDMHIEEAVDMTLIHVPVLCVKLQIMYTWLNDLL